MGTANAISGRLKTVNALYRNGMEVIGNRHSYMTGVDIKIWNVAGRVWCSMRCLTTI